jgi:selenocysteine-specific elongation factor
MGAEGPIALTVGTAGHVDHGKTALVEALTGVNTDRLEEERRRGLSIELGFAELDLGGGRSVGIVDVPGHERFVRTMVAGSTGIDMFLLVAAADEGVMPQTREHLAVLEALEVRAGVVALTKCDRTDADARALAREEASALIPTAPLIEVSAVTGEGIAELRSALGRLAEEAEAGGRHGGQSEAGPVVLHVDRSFTLHGIGTVVTGTLWSGSVSPGDRVEIRPRGIETRVRRVQVHNRDVERGLPGQRVALNLTGVGTREVVRGDTVTSAGSGPWPTYRLDVELTASGGPEYLGGQRVQVHHGTADVPARVIGLGEGLAQLRLELPLVAGADDRFVIRRIAPPGTIGGGCILDPAPPRHGPGERVRERLAAIRERGLDAVVAEERRSADACARAERAGARNDAGPPPLDDRSRLLLALLRADGAKPRAPRALAGRLGIAQKEAVASLDRLVARGLAVRATPEVYYARDALEAVTGRALELARRRGELTLPELRDSLGTSRKYAQAVLEHLDATKATVRHGDRHVLRRGAGL